MTHTLVLPHSLRNVLVGSPPQDWEELLRQREQAAFSKGRSEGERALSEQLVQQRSEISELQRGVLENLRQAVPSVIHQAEELLIKVALESAQKLVAGLPISTELIEGIVREALTRVEDDTEIAIHLHPEDLALLQKHDSRILQRGPDAGVLRFVPSGEISRGGCLVQTRFGLVDARCESKVEQLQASLGLNAD
jgi:flagellar assembly protein FliH